MSPVSGSALASQVAYGQALTRKANEFEKVTSGGALAENQAVIVLERQGSDCLVTSDIDESDKRGGMLLPFFNKSNHAQQTIKENQYAPLSARTPR